MEYAFTTYESIAQVPAGDWERLRTPGDLATDPRLIRCVEEGLAGQGRCWVVVARDSAGDVAAGACLALLRVDTAETTGPVVRGATAAVRRAWPGAMRFGVMFCGLPAPSGDGQLRIVPGADVGAVLRGLDRVTCELARRPGAGMVVIKELDGAAAERIGAAEALGYLRGDVPPIYVLEQSFPDFDAYCGQLRTDYRRRVLRSAKKLEGADLGVEYLRGAEVAAAYTDACHRLYEAVWERAAYRLERWPAEFFRNVARRFGDRASMTQIVARDGRPMAWAFGVTDGGGVYHNLYGGLDYSANGRFDLYFNVYFRDLDRAFKSGVRAINLGQTADWFKARLGAVASPRFFFARGVRPWVQLGLRVGRRWAFPPVATQPEQHVFRNGAAEQVRPGQAAGEPGRARGPEADRGVTPRPSPPPRPGERRA